MAVYSKTNSLWMKKILHGLVAVGIPMKHSIWDYMGCLWNVYHQLAQDLATIHSSKTIELTQT